MGLTGSSKQPVSLFFLSLCFQATMRLAASSTGICCLTHHKAQTTGLINFKLSKTVSQNEYFFGLRCFSQAFCYSNTKRTGTVHVGRHLGPKTLGLSMKGKWLNSEEGRKRAGLVKWLNSEEGRERAGLITRTA